MVYFPVSTQNPKQTTAWMDPWVQNFQLRYSFLVIDCRIKKHIFILEISFLLSRSTPKYVFDCSIFISWIFCYLVKNVLPIFRKKLKFSPTLLWWRNWVVGIKVNSVIVKIFKRKCWRFNLSNDPKDGSRNLVESEAAAFLLCLEVNDFG